MSCCAEACRAAEHHFGERRARADLERYREHGPIPTTRLLAEALEREGVAGASLLDLGPGIGALTFELLARGASRATLIDASPAFLTVARGEAERRRVLDRIEFLAGDAVELADTMPPHDVVMLDRVVCCYPGYGPLLKVAASRAGRILALSYPRDRWFVHLGVGWENLLRRVKHNNFRTFLHPPGEIVRLIEAEGFTLASRRQTLAWCGDVFSRRRH